MSKAIDPHYMSEDDVEYVRQRPNLRREFILQGFGDPLEEDYPGLISNQDVDEEEPDGSGDDSNPDNPDGSDSGSEPEGSSGSVALLTQDCSVDGTTDRCDFRLH